MYCNNCGSPIPDDARFCGKCGKPVAALPQAGARGRVAKHLQVLALVWVVYSAFRLMSGFAMLFAGSMFLPRFLFFPWRFPNFMMHGLIAGMGLGVLVIGLGGLATGWGLWHRESWARILAVILAILALIHFPIGTAVGIYTLWVLLPRDSATEYERPSASA